MCCMYGLPRMNARRCMVDQLVIVVCHWTYSSFLPHFLYAFHKGVDCICEVLLYKEICLKMMVLCAELCTSMYVCERERERDCKASTHSLFTSHQMSLQLSFMNKTNNNKKVHISQMFIGVYVYHTIAFLR